MTKNGKCRCKRQLMIIILLIIVIALAHIISQKVLPGSRAAYLGGLAAPHPGFSRISSNQTSMHYSIKNARHMPGINF